MGGWNMGLPEGTASPASLTIEEVDQRINARITGELQFLDGESWRGIFALSKKHRKTLEAETAVMSVAGNTHRFMCNAGIATIAPSGGYGSNPPPAKVAKV